MNTPYSPPIIQIGAIPPPYGGVSVHLSRLLVRLHLEGLPCELIDISGVPKQQNDVRCMSWRRSLFRLLRSSPAIVHFHNFAPRNLYLYSLLATRHRTVLSFHNERFVAEMGMYGPLEQGLFRRLFDNFDAIIVDSDANYRRAEAFGIAASKLLTIAEFLPPSTGINATQSLPVEINALRSQHGFLLATNAYSLAFHRGEDMYGIDLIVETMGSLVNQPRFDVACVILLPNPDNAEYLERLQGRIRELSIQDRCLIVTSPLAETSCLWKAADIVIRATNTDGNSMSILEALACGTPVVASDCVERHPAVALFENRNAGSLTAKIQDVLEHLDRYRSTARAARLEDNGMKFVEVYRRLAASIKQG